MAANLVAPKTESEIKKLTTMKGVKDSYKRMNSCYKKMINTDILLCPKCGQWKDSEAYFYKDDKFEVGRFPVCKQCLIQMVEQRDTKGESHETEESVQAVLMFMDRPYIWDVYEDCIKNSCDETRKYRTSAFSSYMTMLQSLPQYKGKTWKHSVFDTNNSDTPKGNFVNNEFTENSRLIKAARKRFGEEYEISDLKFLETQYEDWVSRYECQTKAQEEIFERLAFKKWEINKATKAGAPTEKLDRTYQDLLNTANITPKQTGMDSFADAQTLGTLIQKWEETRPLPEIDPEFQDVDKIGLYLDAFFRGHTSKMLGIKNAFSNIYEKVMSKYTVKPPSYEDDEDSEAAFNRIFGSREDY